MIANRFINECSGELEEEFNPLDAEELKFQVFTNMLDSHIWFNSPRVQSRFETWRSEFERE
jgi:hypothetical protein